MKRKKVLEEKVDVNDVMERVMLYEELRKKGLINLNLSAVCTFPRGSGYLSTATPIDEVVDNMIEARPVKVH